VHGCDGLPLTARPDAIKNGIWSAEDEPQLKNHMARLARTYVAFLFVLQLLLLGASVLLHIYSWLWPPDRLAQVGDEVLLGSLLLVVISAFLAKEKNIWKNEFKSCPIWLRALGISFGVYGMLAALCRTALFPSSGGPEDDLLTISAMSLSFNAIFVCIPYAILWTGSVPVVDIIRRSRASFIAAIAVITLLLAERAGYLPHPGRRGGP
jgi:hypothetical protein